VDDNDQVGRRKQVLNCYFGSYLRITPVVKIKITQAAATRIALEYGSRGDITVPINAISEIAIEPTIRAYMFLLKVSDFFSNSQIFTKRSPSFSVNLLPQRIQNFEQSSFIFKHTIQSLPML